MLRVDKPAVNDPVRKNTDEYRSKGDSMASTDYMEFGFDAGDESLQGGKFERFKAKQGETYRISFVWWEMVNGQPNLDANSPKFVGAKRFFIPNVGYILDRGPEFAKLAGQPSKPTVATVVAIWPTDRKGALDKTRFAQGDVDVKPWVFSQERYDQLKRRHAEFPLGQFDMTAACTDTQYQKMDLSPCRDSLFRRVLENDRLRPIADVILAKTAAIVGANSQGEPLGLRGIVARDMSIDKVREKLGGAPAAVASPELTSQVDNLIDDLLDPE